MRLTGMGERDYTLMDSRSRSAEERASFFCPELAIGIDIGTSQCTMAIWNGYKVEILQNMNKKILQPFVSFRDKKPITGVRGQLSLEDEMQSGNVFFNLKSLIGRSDMDPDILECTSTPFLEHEFGAGFRRITTAMQNSTWKPTVPEILLAIFLKEVKSVAEEQLNRLVKFAIVTSPVSFSRSQLFMIATSCTLAGFAVFKQLPEPLAVSLVYAAQEHMNQDHQKIALILNVGAGFCDVAVATANIGVSRIEATLGDSVGGERLLENMMRHLLPEFDALLSRHGTDDVSAFGLLRVTTQNVIHKLSLDASAEIDADLGNGLKVSKTVTRQEFEDVNVTVFERLEFLIRQCLSNANVEPKDLDDVILVGGCSRIPKIRDTVLSVCQKEEFYQGNNLFVGWCSCIPKIRDIVLSVCQKEEEFYQGINPLEGAVCGAALYGAMSSRAFDPHGDFGLLIMEGTRFSLGIRVYGGGFVPIIPRNTSIPTIKDLVFTTFCDNQDEALIAVYEGEGSEVAKNLLLGHVMVKGIPLAPKGVPEINVSMEFDSTNVLKVYVKAMLQENDDQSMDQVMEVRLPFDFEWHGPCADDLNKIYGSSLDSKAVCRKT